MHFCCAMYDVTQQVALGGRVSPGPLSLHLSPSSPDSMDKDRPEGTLL
jgi:hypothetical protein